MKIKKKNEKIFLEHTHNIEVQGKLEIMNTERKRKKSQKLNWRQIVILFWENVSE